MRKQDNNRKTVRIHNEVVNNWVETLPYGMFTEMINGYLEKVCFGIKKEQTKEFDIELESKIK